MAAIIKHFEYLGDPDHSYWLPLTRGREWDGPGWHHSSYLLAIAPVWVSVGHLFRRQVACFRLWPWRLGLLVGDEVSDDSKRRISHDLFECDHVDAFTAAYKSALSGPDEVLNPENVQFTADVFENCPTTNVSSEERFSRTSQRRRSAQGMHAKPTTIASNHVLAESKTLLDIGWRPAAELSRNKCANMLLCCVCCNVL